MESYLELGESPPSPGNEDIIEGIIQSTCVIMQSQERSHSLYLIRFEIPNYS